MERISKAAKAHAFLGNERVTDPTRTSFKAVSIARARKAPSDGLLRDRDARDRARSDGE
jgi:hypothetical protein